jgi:hypothetical protein
MYCPGICLEGLRKFTRKLGQYTQCLGRDFNKVLSNTSLANYRCATLLGYERGILKKIKILAEKYNTLLITLGRSLKKSRKT